MYMYLSITTCMVKPGSHLFACVALQPEVHMKWFVCVYYAEIEKFYSCMATRIQIILYALPVATQRKQKDVNQALDYSACQFSTLIGHLHMDLNLVVFPLRAPLYSVITLNLIHVDYCLCTEFYWYRSRTWCNIMENRTTVRFSSWVLSSSLIVGPTVISHLKLTVLKRWLMENWAIVVIEVDNVRVGRGCDVWCHWTVTDNWWLSL